MVFLIMEIFKFNIYLSNLIINLLFLYINFHLLISDELAYISYIERCFIYYKQMIPIILIKYNKYNFYFIKKLRYLIEIYKYNG